MPPPALDERRGFRINPFASWGEGAEEIPASANIPSSVMAGLLLRFRLPSGSEDIKGIQLSETPQPLRFR